MTEPNNSNVPGKGKATLKRLASLLPILRKQQTCPACGTSFACELSLASGCWCNEIKLSDETRQKLRANYDGCLCRACLEKAESDAALSTATGA